MLYEGILLATLIFTPQNINIKNPVSPTLLTTNINQINKYFENIEQDSEIKIYNPSKTLIGDIGAEINIIIDSTNYMFVREGSYGENTGTYFSYYGEEQSELDNGIYAKTQETPSETQPKNWEINRLYLTTTNNNQESIVNGITDGISLMNPISEQFLDGFSTLFWDSTANSGSGGLTTFGNFCLIFLGVSITFAVVKLALNLIRGKTGA